MKELEELQKQFPGLVRLLTRKDVARLAGVSVATIKRDVKRGLLREIIVNARRRRFHPKDVEAYLAAKFPALAYTKRRLLTVGMPGTTPGGNVETPDSNDSPPPQDAKIGQSEAKLENCPQKCGQTQEKGDSGPIIPSETPACDARPFCLLVRLLGGSAFCRCFRENHDNSRLLPGWPAASRLVASGSWVIRHSGLPNRYEPKSIPVQPNSRMHALNIENIVVDEANHRTYVVLASKVLSDGEVYRAIRRELLKRGGIPPAFGETLTFDLAATGSSSSQTPCD